MCSKYQYVLNRHSRAIGSSRKQPREVKSTECCRKQSRETESCRKQSRATERSREPSGAVESNQEKSRAIGGSRVKFEHVHNCRTCSLNISVVLGFVEWSSESLDSSSTKVDASHALFISIYNFGAKIVRNKFTSLRRRPPRFEEYSQQSRHFTQICRKRLNIAQQ